MGSWSEVAVCFLWACGATVYNIISYAHKSYASKNVWVNYFDHFLLV